MQTLLLLPLLLRVRSVGRRTVHCDWLATTDCVLGSCIVLVLLLLLQTTEWYHRHAVVGDSHYNNTPTSAIISWLSCTCVCAPLRRIMRVEVRVENRAPLLPREESGSCCAAMETILLLCTFTAIMLAWCTLQL